MDECPIDIINLICLDISMLDLFPMRTVCKTIYSNLVKRCNQVEGLSIRVESKHRHNKRVIIFDNGCVYKLGHYKILRNFKMLKYASINESSSIKYLKKSIRHLPKRISNLTIDGEINTFKWGTLKRLRELTHLTVDINMFLEPIRSCPAVDSGLNSIDGYEQIPIKGSSFEYDIIDALYNTKLYYLYFPGYDYDWGGVDFLFLLEYNIPADKLEEIRRDVDKGRKERKFMAHFMKRNDRDY
jgi:hypothetical protein